MGRTNISETLNYRAERIAKMVNDISVEYGMNRNEAIQVVRTAALSQHTDVMYHIEQILEETTDAICAQKG